MTLSPDDLRELRTAGRKHREWEDRRNRAIVTAVENGASLREVAEAVGISHTAVASIVKRYRRR